MKLYLTLFIFVVISQLQLSESRHRPIDMVALEEAIKEDVLYEMSIPHRRCGHKLISAISRVCSGSADIIFAKKPENHQSVMHMCCYSKCSDLDLLSFCGERKNSDLFYELEK